MLKPVARIGDQHICGNPGHAPNAIVSGGQGIVEGQRVARVTDKCACGAVIIQGAEMSKDTGQPIAYVGAKTQCGQYTGTIVSGAKDAKVWV